MEKIILPEFLATLDFASPVISHAVAAVKKTKGEKYDKTFAGSPYFRGVERIDETTLKMIPNENLYYQVLSEIAGETLATQGDIVAYISKVSALAAKFAPYAAALDQIESTGYGVVSPSFADFKLEKPTLYKNGKSHGVRFQANASCLHLIRVDVGCTVAPVIGDLNQSQEMLKFLTREYETNPRGVWETPIFGKSLETLVREEIANKSVAMPAAAKGKIQKTLSRIINNGRGGVICILL
jgi:stage IV sporulation protein A